MARRFALESWCLSLYLGTAPVYWLPVVPISAINQAKITLFAVALGMVFLRLMARGKIYLPRGLWGPMGFIVLSLLSIPGIVQARDGPSGIALVTDIWVSAIIIWCFFNLARLGCDLRTIFVRSLAIISLFSMLTITNKLIGWPNWYMPKPDWLLEEINNTSLFYSGFSFFRTVWSNGLALYWSVVLFLIATRPEGVAVRQFFFATVACGILIGSQLVSGGRAGIVAVLPTIAMFTLMRFSRWLGVLIIVIGSAFIMIMPTDYLISLFRIEIDLRLKDLSSITFRHLDMSSTYRLGGYVQGLEKIQERPLLGHGINQVTAKIHANIPGKIHNIWLKWAVSNGILMPLFFTAMIGAVLRHAVRLLTGYARNTADREAAAVYSLIVLAGIVGAMFQPEALLGPAYTSLWCSAVAALLAIHSKRRAIAA